LRLHELMVGNANEIVKTVSHDLIQGFFILSHGR
jgi:hypothetical protein